MTKLLVAKSRRVIDSLCAECGQKWHDHGSGGWCPLRYVEEFSYWRQAK